MGERCGEVVGCGKLCGVGLRYGSEVLYDGVCT